MGSVLKIYEYSSKWTISPVQNYLSKSENYHLRNLLKQELRVPG